MIWTVYGIKAGGHGNMNTSIVGAAKHYVHYMQEVCLMILFDC